MKVVETGEGYSHSVGYSYDTINNLTQLVETINGTEYETSYTYDDDNRITNVDAGTAAKDYAYDSFGRNHQQTIKHGSTTVKTDSFSFRSPSDTATSSQVTGHTIDAAGYDKAFTYEYDDNGNITVIKENNVEIASYVYDSANQLIRENNRAGNFTRTWNYDNAGNIQSRSQYGYTTGALGEPTETISYTYENEGWGDLLTEYNGNAITYDEIGNPLSDGTNTYTWKHGRQLATLNDGTKTWTYTYNSDGLRTKRTDGTNTYEYVYNGDKLSLLTIKNGSTTRTLRFTYDASGPVSVLVTSGGVSSTYYYVTNLQGDVVALLNTSGTAVVEYTYDAWGNVLRITGIYKDGLGIRNPLRYRGYVYDQDTELYYLQSRYYNPTTGRFLVPDEYPSTGQGLVGNNMFSYCGNNPVVRKDSAGNLWETVWDIASLAISIADVCANPEDPWAWAGLVGDIIDVIIPCVGGIGEITKGIRVACTAGEIADTTADVSKTTAVVAKSVNTQAVKSARSKAVRDAWKQEVDLVKATGKGSYRWTEEQICELLSTGRVKGYQGHHMKCVSKYPLLAGDPNNIQFLSRAEHLQAHRGNWRNPTHGRFYLNEIP